MVLIKNLKEIAEMGLTVTSYAEVFEQAQRRKYGLDQPAQQTEQVAATSERFWVPSKKQIAQAKQRQFKHFAKGVFLRNNGVAIVVDNRVKTGECSKVQEGVWAVHSDSLQAMEVEVVRKGFEVRQLSQKERERLTRRAQVMIDIEEARKKNAKRKPVSAPVPVVEKKAGSPPPKPKRKDKKFNPKETK